MDAAEEARFLLPGPDGPLDATWLAPLAPAAQLVFAHGAGADHRHANMQAIANALADVGIATLRYNFPFMQAGKRRADRPEVAVEAVKAAVEHARSQSSLPLFAGGHSFGGRMTSLAAAQAKIDCHGLVFCSFPLHPPKKPGIERAAHLSAIPRPMLFLSGTRDDLAERGLLEGVLAGLQSQARLHWLETANHSYVVLKRTRTNPLNVFTEIGGCIEAFVEDVLASRL